MHKIRNWSSLLPTAATALLAALFVTAGCHQAQQPAATTAAKPSIQLQTYTAPDQSASAGVPAGWQVSAGKDTVIQMTGPHGETVFLGNTIIAKNGAFKAGQRGPNGTELSMPYSAPLAQKMIMIFEQNAAVAGKPAPQVTVDSATPIQAAPVLGQCGRFVASAAGGQEPLKVMAVYCSFPVDSGGAYKNVMLLAQAPAAVAEQSAPIAQAIFQSYRIPPPWLQKKLAPFNAPPLPMAVRSGGGVGGMNSSTILSEMGADNAANCFDLGVLRETPQYDLPRSCGGLKPD